MVKNTPAQNFINPASVNPLVEQNLDVANLVNAMNNFAQNINAELLIIKIMQWISFVMLAVMIVHVIVYTESLFLYFYITVLSIICTRFSTIIFTGNYIITYIFIPIMCRYHLYIYDLFGVAESYEPSLAILLGATAGSLISIELLIRKLSR